MCRIFISLIINIVYNRILTNLLFRFWKAFIKHYTSIYVKFSPRLTHFFSHIKHRHILYML